MHGWAWMCVSLWCICVCLCQYVPDTGVGVLFKLPCQQHSDQLLQKVLSVSALCMDALGNEG